MATFVAETWASTGAPEFGWPGAVEPFLAPEFDAGAIPIEPALGSGTVRAARAVAIDATETAIGQQVIVTLEELRTIDDETRWRLLVIEVLLLQEGERWVVASLEVLA